jgi:hypothetical protein
MAGGLAGAPMGTREILVDATNLAAARRVLEQQTRL